MDPTALILSSVICPTTKQFCNSNVQLILVLGSQRQNHLSNINTNPQFNPTGRIFFKDLWAEMGLLTSAQHRHQTSLWCIIWQPSNPTTFRGISHFPGAFSLSSARKSGQSTISFPPFSLSQLQAKKFRPSVSGQGHPLLLFIHLSLLDTLYLTVPRGLLPAPCAVWSLRAVLAVQRRSEPHPHIHPVDHDHELRGCIRTLLAALGLLVRWREGARSAEEQTYNTLGAFVQFSLVQFSFYSLFDRDSAQCSTDKRTVNY